MKNTYNVPLTRWNLYWDEETKKQVKSKDNNITILILLIRNSSHLEPS